MEEKYNTFGEPISPQDSLKQPDTLFQKIFSILSILLLTFILLYPAIKWNQLPDRIISHWGFNGQADGWSGKSSVLFYPCYIFDSVHPYYHYHTLSFCLEYARERLQKETKDGPTVTLKICWSS